MQYDCIIVGTGPAGVEAALNLKIREKSFLLLGSEQLSSKLQKAPQIHNYLGFPQVTGAELAAAFLTHLSANGISITDERVSAVYPMGSYFSVAAGENVYNATTVILATGVYAAKLYLGEEKFLGRGIGYCATCDAPLYKGKTVAVIGTSAEAETEANFVAEIAQKVYYIPVASTPTLLDPSVEAIKGVIKSIEGTSKAEKLVLDSGEVVADGFFILRESIAPSTLLPGLETEGAHIKVSAEMCTNLPGCFAAGDCTGTPYQFIRAAGQGLVAANSAVAYLAAQKYEMKG